MGKELYIRAASSRGANGWRQIFSFDFWSLLLVPFIVCTMTVSYVKGLSTIVILYGTVISSLFALYFLYHRLAVQSEVLIYFVWIAWSLGGFSNVVDNDLYFGQLKTIIQVGFLMFVISGISALQKDISRVMLGIMIGGTLVAASVIITGEFATIVAGNSSVRAEGLTGNANDLAYCLLFVIVAVFFLWGKEISPWWRAFFLAAATISVILIVLSGSRKGYLGVIVFVFLWWVFCKKKRLRHNMLAGYLVLILVSAGLYYATTYVLTKTHLGQRFEQLDNSGDQKRVQMYKEGLDMIRRNPIFGVGLDNYRALSSSGLYSHSDYIEVAANTGMVGFILYFSIYAVLWLRLNRIRKVTRDSRTSYVVGLFKASILTILLIAFGRPNITSKLTWIFLATAIGYSWATERTLQLRMQRCRLKK